MCLTHTHTKVTSCIKQLVRIPTAAAQNINVAHSNPFFFILSWRELYAFVSGVTILLSLTVFSLLVAELLPQTSDAVPLIG